MFRRSKTYRDQARKLWRILKTPAYWQALRQGVAAAVEHEDIPYSAAFNTVVDVGANRGQFAVVAARRFPEARLWCFEPLPDARVRLQTILRHREHSTIIGTALADRADQRRLHVTHDDDSSSLLRVGHLQRAEFPRTHEVSRMPVQTTRLDEFLTRGSIAQPALLKIDVQGTELAVLQGTTSIIDAFDAIIVECSFVELYVGQAPASHVIAFLASHGHHLRGVYGATYGADGACLQADLLFAPE